MKKGICKCKKIKVHHRIHEINNKLFTFFFKFIVQEFQKLYIGGTRFHWIARTRLNRVRVFCQDVLGYTGYEAKYPLHEALIFKMIFRTYTKEQMINEYKFSPKVLGEEFDIIENCLKRRLTIRNMKKFMNLGVV